jgi:hypothetical protein
MFFKSYRIKNMFVLIGFVVTVDEFLTFSEMIKDPTKQNYQPFKKWFL